MPCSVGRKNGKVINERIKEKGENWKYTNNEDSDNSFLREKIKQTSKNEFVILEYVLYIVNLF
jgi:hypothetical protein